MRFTSVLLPVAFVVIGCMVSYLSGEAHPFSPRVALWAGIVATGIIISLVVAVVVYALVRIGSRPNDRGGPDGRN